MKPPKVNIKFAKIFDFDDVGENSNVKDGEGDIDLPPISADMREDKLQDDHLSLVDKRPIIFDRCPPNTSAKAVHLRICSKSTSSKSYDYFCSYMTHIIIMTLKVCKLTTRVYRSMCGNENSSSNSCTEGI
jgi:hypothetical protein